jgi:hypothetical protein
MSLRWIGCILAADIDDLRNVWSSLDTQVEESARDLLRLQA